MSGLPLRTFQELYQDTDDTVKETDRQVQRGSTKSLSTGLTHRCHDLQDLGNQNRLYSLDTTNPISDCYQYKGFCTNETFRSNIELLNLFIC